jgi:hypothetical protein
VTPCTWKDCTEQAWHEQKATDGEVWADLCTDHVCAYTAAITAGSAPRILAAWIRAQGGVTKAADRMLREIGL